MPGIFNSQRNHLPRVLILLRSIIEAIQDADGFRYAERRAVNKEGGDGSRFKYICLDSFQNKYRTSNMKEEESPVDGEGEEQQKEKAHTRLATYDCGGAIHNKCMQPPMSRLSLAQLRPGHRDNLLNAA